MKKIILLISIIIVILCISDFANADLLGQYTPNDFGSIYDNWVNSEEVFLQDDTYSSCKNSENEDFYNFEIDGDIAEFNCLTIDGIKVYVDGYCPSASIEYYKIKLSWNGGSSWTSIKNTGTIGTTDTDTYVNAGGASDTWGRTWDKEDFYNENFLFYIEGYSSGVISGTLYTDHIYIEIYYTFEIPDMPNTVRTILDGSNCSRVDFLFVKGDGADTTLFRWSTEDYPTYTTGTFLYNGSGNQFEVSFNFGYQYYVCAWSWSNTYCTYSQEYDTLFFAPCSNEINIETNIVNATFNVDTFYSKIYGWTIIFNSTGNETICGNTSLTLLTDMYRVADENNSVYNFTTGWKVWVNASSAIVLYENIENATGTHEYIYSDYMEFYKVWANYTGNETGGNCNLQYFNYEDENITINITYYGCNNTNTSGYEINEDNWLNLASTLLFDNSQIFLFLLLSIWLYFVNKYYELGLKIHSYIQFGVMIPLTISIALISLSYPFGFVVIFVVPAISIYIVAEGAYFGKK